jgi:PAS domain S-box-containing protein
MLFVCESPEFKYNKFTMNNNSDDQIFRDFSNSISDVFFALDRELNYQYWNNACENMFGVKSEEVIGKSW